MNFEFETHNRAKAPETCSSPRTFCYLVRSWEPMKIFFLHVPFLEFGFFQKKRERKKMRQGM